MSEPFSIPKGIWNEEDGVRSCRQISSVPEMLQPDATTPTAAATPAPALASSVSRSDGSETTMSPGSTQPRRARDIDSDVSPAVRKVSRAAPAAVPEDLVELLEWRPLESKGLMMGIFKTMSMDGKHIDVAENGTELQIHTSSKFQSFELPPEINPHKLPNSVRFDKKTSTLKIRFSLLE